MIKSTSRVFALLLISFTLVNWGYQGHQTINGKCIQSFPATMVGFSAWQSALIAHASDADNRKSSDPSESPKHYIDIDNYNEFKTTGRIASTYDSIVSLYGSTTVLKNGILPWATLDTYDLLVNDFKSLNWSKAVLDASDLGHYVGDGHMPLHLTANYDGQLSGQKGIHSHYETDMVGAYINDLSNYTGIQASYVSNKSNFVFSYIYHNYLYKDSILIADNYAKNIDASYGTAYTAALWSKTKFTTTLFKNASYSLGALIYSAWVDAGSPPFNATSFPNALNENHATNIIVFPNPSTGIVTLKGAEIDKTEITSLTGQNIRTEHKTTFDLSNLANGIYFLNVYNKNGLVKKEKVLLSK
jgi:hypothetical protein